MNLVFSCWLDAVRRHHFAFLTPNRLSVTQMISILRVAAFLCAVACTVMATRMPKEVLERRRHLLSKAQNEVSTWSCFATENKTVVPSVDNTTYAVQWTRVNCTGATPVGEVGPMVFNIIHADLGSPRLYFTPMTANTSDQLAPLNNIAAQDAKIIAGINGGYFYRTDATTFIDNVCWGKNITDAEKPASAANPNDGVGDTLVVVDGKRVSSNCDCIGYNRPALFVSNKTHSYITVQGLADPPPPGVESCIAAGPNLVSYNRTAGSFVHIPADDQNSNILEWSSNTATGIKKLSDGRSELVLVTADGFDGCHWLDPTCGLDAYHFAFFMKDYVKVTTAMEMDQGGSTTMFIKGEGKNGIVSCASAGCTGSSRPLFSALMIGQNY